MADDKLIEWLDELCGEAVKAAEGGDLGMMNRLGHNPSLNYYLQNVYTRSAMTRPDFSQSTHMPEARRVYTQYQENVEREAAEKARDTRMETIEGKLDTLQKLIQESLTPKKSGKKSAEEDE